MRGVAGLGETPAAGESAWESVGDELTVSDAPQKRQKRAPNGTSRAHAGQFMACAVVYQRFRWEGIVGWPSGHWV